MRSARIHRLPTAAPSTDDPLLPLAIRLEGILHARFPHLADRSRVAIAHEDGAVEVRLTALRLSAAETSEATGFLAAVTALARTTPPPASRAHRDGERVIDLGAHRRAS